MVFQPEQLGVGDIACIRFVQALVDRPDEERRVISFRRLALTDLKIDVPRLAAKKVLTKAFTDEGKCVLLQKEHALQFQAYRISVPTIKLVKGATATNRSQRILIHELLQKDSFHRPKNG